MRKPQFQLQSVFSNGSKSEPQLYQIQEIDSDWNMARRGFLLTTAIGATLLSSCIPRPKATLDQTPMPEVQKGSCPEEIKAAMNAVDNVFFSPDNKFLLSSEGWTFKLWEMPGGKLVKSLEGHIPFCFSPDSKFLAFSGVSWEHTIKLWEMPNGTLKSLYGHEDFAASLYFSPDSKLLASGSSDRTIKLWDMQAGALLKSLKEEGQAFYGSMSFRSVCFSPDGNLLASGSNLLMRDNIKLWDIASGTLLKSFDCKDFVNSVCFSPDGKLLASGSTDKTVKLWEIPSGALLRVMSGHANDVITVCFSPDGKHLASRSLNDFKLWEVPTGALLKSMDNDKRAWEAPSVCFSPDGKFLASTTDKTIKLWELPSGKLLMTLKGHKKFINSISFSTNGKLLASGSDDMTIKLWEMPSGKFITCLFDPAALEKDKEVNQYTLTTEDGQIITYTVPCGSRIPPGAICTCNCVAGTSPYVTGGPASGPSRSGGTICSCDKICTCVPIK